MRYYRVIALTAALVVPLAVAIAQDGDSKSPVGGEDKSPKAVIFRQGNETVIEADISAKMTTGSVASVMIYRKDRTLSKRVIDERSVPECSTKSSPDTVCIQHPSPDVVRFVYRPTDPVAADAKYEFGYFISDVRRGDIGEIVTVAPIIDKAKPDVGEITASEITNEFRTEIKRHPNGEISIGVQFPPDEKSSEDARRYVDGRIRALYDWLEPRTLEPKGVATVRIEPRTTRIPNNEPYTFPVVAMRLEPSGFNEAVATGTFNIVLVTSRLFPPGKYDIEVVFDKAAPPELSGKLTNSLAGAAIKSADASTAGNDKSYVLRDIKNNLDLALAYTSSVQSTQIGNRTVVGRQNNGVIDMRFAPLLDWHKDGDFKNYFTPFFIDAKVANGRITSKTLSLNRIVLGTEFMRRDVMLSSKNKNKFVYFFRGLSASDRDFKRAEENSISNFGHCSIGFTVR